MSPLFGERVTEGFGAVRTQQQSEYQKWLRECWSEELQRELTPVEIEVRKRGQSLSPSAPVNHPPDVAGSSNDSSKRGRMGMGDGYPSTKQVEAEQRAAQQKAAEDLARRKEAEARQQAFLLEDELDRDMKDRLGL